MPHVSLKHKNESFESLLRRFKKSVEKSEVLKILREREFFERPGEKRKRARAAAVKRQQRLTQELEFARRGIKLPTKKEEDKKKWHKNDQSSNQSSRWF